MLQSDSRPQVAVPDRLPASFFSTAALPPSERFAAWRDSVSTMFDIRLDPGADPHRFHATVAAYLIGPISLACFSAGKQAYRRSAARIAQDGIDHYMIQVYRRGAGRAMRYGGDVVFGTGSVVIFDNAQPLDSVDDDSDLISLFIPRALLAPHLRVSDSQHLRCMPADSPLAFLLRNHMEALLAAASQMTAGQGLLAVEPTVALVASMLAGMPQAVEGGGEAVETALLTAIRRHIAERIDDPQLTPDGIAGQFAIARSRLYRLFEPFGGVADYIRSNRLRRAFALLADPRQQHRRVIDIALDLGFGSENSFARAFRRHYDMSPGEVRRSGGCIAGAPSVTGGFGDRQWESWIRRT